MPPRKQSKEPSSTSNSARRIFKARAEQILRDLQKELGPRLESSTLANLIMEYLQLGNKRVSVPIGNRSMKFRAMDIAHQFHPPLTGPNFEVIGQKDFEQSAGVLLTDENLLLLEKMMRKVKAEAKGFNLHWKVAGPILEQIAKRLLPDRRPLDVRRGEDRAEYIKELGQIREALRTWRSFDEFKATFPDFEIIEIVAGPPFKDEDRESLMAPSQWETRTATYCNGLLKRYWNVGEDSLKSYRKAGSALSRKSREKTRRRRLP